MKKLVFVLIFSLFSSLASADADSILQDGFLGIVAKMTQSRDELNPVFGFRGGWIMNHSYGVGAGFYGGGKIEAHDPGNVEGKRDVAFYYFGIETEYTAAWDSRIHYTIHALTGIGGLSYTGDVDKKDFEPEYDSSGSSLSFDDGLLIFEPSVNVEVNVTKSIRITTGLVYRAVAGVELDGLDNADVGGPGVSLTVKFGKYR
ncbi:hypothetical protein ACFL47_08780 [Candidatus Latescibacterota bacterium]